MARDDDRDDDDRSGSALTRRPMGGPPMMPPGGPPQEVDSLCEWIKGAFQRAQVASFSLGQRSAADGTLSAISSWAAEDFDKYDGPEGLSQNIMEEAYRDAQTQRGTTRYVVQAFKEGESAHFAKHSFRLDGALERTSDDEDSYPATEKGVLALMIKHTEFSVRSLQQGFDQMMRSMGGQIGELHRQNNKMAAMQYQVLDLQQAMMDRQAERELAVREQDAKDKRKQQIFEKVLILLPVIIQKLLGKKGADSILAEEQIGSLIDSISPDQMATLVGAFTDEQRIAFMSFVMQYKDRRKKLSETEDETKQRESAQVRHAEEEQQAEAERQAEADRQAEAERQAAEAQAEAEKAAAEAAEAASRPVVIDPAIEAMVAVLGDDLNDERLDVIAQSLPEDKRAMLAAAVIAYRKSKEPPAPIDPTVELLLKTLGNDFTDEKVGRIAEKLDEERRRVFLIEVENYRARNPLPSSQESAAAPEPTPETGA